LHDKNDIADVASRLDPRVEQACWRIAHLQKGCHSADKDGHVKCYEQPNTNAIPLVRRSQNSEIEGENAKFN